MNYEMLAQARIADAFREAEKSRLGREINNHRPSGVKRKLVKFICQIGLVSTC